MGIITSPEIKHAFPVNVGRTMLSVFVSALAWNTPAATFGVLGNEATKALIKAWAPQPLGVGSGSVFTSAASVTNMKRYVQARLLLEDMETGCLFTCDDTLTVFLCKFENPGTRIQLPLWNPSEGRPPVRIFKDLKGWHSQTLGQQPLSVQFDWPEDRQAWHEACSP